MAVLVSMFQNEIFAFNTISQGKHLSLPSTLVKFIGLLPGVVKDDHGAGGLLLPLLMQSHVLLRQLLPHLNTESYT